MNKLFKLGRITDETMAAGGGTWSEIEGNTCTTTFSDNRGNSKKC